MLLDWSFSGSGFGFRFEDFVFLDSGFKLLDLCVWPVVLLWILDFHIFDLDFGLLYK